MFSLSLFLVGFVGLTSAADFDYLFQQFYRKTDYTATELEYFRDNFKRHYEQTLQEEYHNQKAELDEVELRTLLEDSEPVVTEKKARDLNQKLSLWTAENSQRFSGWSIRDAKRSMGTFIGKDYKELPNTYAKEHMSMAEADLPTEFNSVEKWGDKCPTIGHIRDQSTCGSCWAFGSTEAFNDRTCIAKGTGGMMLSAQHTASCCGMRACFSFGCDGGQPAYAWEWLVSQGVVTGGDYEDKGKDDTCWPYELPECSHHVKGKLPPCSGDSDTPTCRASCANEKYPNPFKQDKHDGHKSYNIQSVSAIKEQLVKNGPVTGAFTVYDDFPLYKHGVYEPAPGRKELGGHAIKIVGYGSDPVPYWLVANSWNPTWGDKGFFKIKMGVCGIDNAVSAGDIVESGSLEDIQV